MSVYLVQKRMEIAYAHSLDLPYESKCNNLHGHNGIVTVYCRAKDVDQRTGMVIDFTCIKKLIHDKLDHKHLNFLAASEVLPMFNPTAENMAKWVCDTINKYEGPEKAANCICYRVDFQESEGNVATYLLDEVC